MIPFTIDSILENVGKSRSDDLPCEIGIEFKAFYPVFVVPKFGQKICKNSWEGVCHDDRLFIPHGHSLSQLIQGTEETTTILSFNQLVTIDN